MWNYETDLFLTFDFALKSEIESLGGSALYIDNLASENEMQKNNYLASEFFKSWHLDKDGNDICTSEDIPFGFSFRIEIWSEFLYYVRLRANLEKLKTLNYQFVYLSEANNNIASILKEVGINFTVLPYSPQKKVAYFFDIHQYLFNALHAFNWHNIARNVLVKIFSFCSYYFDCIFSKNKNITTIYAQIYHPTASIVDHLKKTPKIRVITSSLSKSKNWRSYLAQRLIPIIGITNSYKTEAELLKKRFFLNKNAKLILADGTNITKGAYKTIEDKVVPLLPRALQILHSAIHYIERNPIHLEIMIANLGLVQTIVDCVLKKKQVPSYLVINGLLGGGFCDEGKYATVINCYSTSIKQHYYNNAENVFCLGDPRMDNYINNSHIRTVDRLNPTISIGTSGFNNLDLISYVAVEFEFMYDILKAFQHLKVSGESFNIIIKVRPNGFLEQYKSFVSEYFPDLTVEIIREVPISQVLLKTDLYISIYSQTLFEASCLGIPVIYYKKDKEFLDPPFDKKSELVTVDNIDDLKHAFFDFKNGSNRYDHFLNKAVMEKYVGPLDGKNLERNLEFVTNLINQNKHMDA